MIYEMLPRVLIPSPEALKAQTPRERFLYAAEERHRIYLRRLDGGLKPWTDDPIFQSFYFTNVYRELDKTTAWYRTNVREPLDGEPEVLMATIIFRWFNLIATGEVLQKHKLLVHWDPDRAIALLSRRRTDGEQLFTGAFMINSPAGEPKLEAIIRRIDNVWARQFDLLIWLRTATTEQRTMQGLHRRLMEFDGLGGFMAYEIVCDLRFTYFLRDAPDIMTWANPGPGAIRGMFRILDRSLAGRSNSSSPPKPKEWDAMIVSLRHDLEERMRTVFGPSVPAIEAREVEMWLCEFDKYERLLFAQGQSKRRYPGVA